MDFSLASEVMKCAATRSVGASLVLGGVASAYCSQVWAPTPGFH